MDGKFSNATFEILCDDLRPSFPDQARSVREPLQLGHRVAIAVYWMAPSAEYRTIANLFGVGKSTVHKCIHDVCTAMAENSLDKYVNSLQMMICNMSLMVLIILGDFQWKNLCISDYNI